MVTGLRVFRGTMTRLSLLMLLKNLFPLSQRLHVLVSRKGIWRRMIVVAGKAKEIGTRAGEKPMLGKDNPSFS